MSKAQQIAFDAAKAGMRQALGLLEQKTLMNQELNQQLMQYKQVNIPALQAGMKHANYQMRSAIKLLNEQNLKIQALEAALVQAELEKNKLKEENKSLRAVAKITTPTTVATAQTTVFFHKEKRTVELEGNLNNIHNPENKPGK